MDFAFFEAFRALVDRVEALEDAVFEDEDDDQGDDDADDDADG